MRIPSPCRVIQLICLIVISVITLSCVRSSDIEPSKSTRGIQETPVVEGGLPITLTEVLEHEQQTVSNAFIYVEDYGDFEPKWSPDGSRILFGSDRDGDFDIYIMNADGSNVTNLISDSDRVLSSLLLLTEQHRDGGQEWSPEGDRVVFASSRDNTRHSYTSFALYVMNFNGSQVVRLTDTGEYDLYPSWSPDGGRIVFVSTKGGDPNLYTVKSDGSELTQLTFLESRKNSPDWSLDGEEIVFSSNHEGDYEIYLIDSDGSNLRRVTNYLGDDVNPSWSPDGKQIVFVSDRDGDKEIYVMDADGTNVAQLTHNNKEEHHPAWSPDGNQIAFSSNREGGWRIFLMDRDGSNPVRMTGGLVGASPIESAEYYLNTGLAQFLKTGENGEVDFDLVIESFSNAIAMNPHLGEAYLGRGLAYLFRCEVIWYWLMLMGGDALQENIDACEDLDKAILDLEMSLDLGLESSLSTNVEQMIELLR